MILLTNPRSPSTHGPGQKKCNKHNLKQRENSKKRELSVPGEEELSPGAHPAYLPHRNRHNDTGNTEIRWRFL